MSVITRVVLFLTICVVQNYAARILAFYPTPSISHQVVFRPLTLELVKRGHEVTVITTDPIFSKGQAPANLTEIDVHDLSYDKWRREFVNTDITKGSEDDFEEQATIILRLMIKVFEKQISTDAVREIINDKSKKFDLLLLEAYPSEVLIFSHLFKAPVIQFSSFGSLLDNLRVVGAPSHPLVHPTLLRQRIYDLTPWERIREVYKHLKYERLFSQVDELRNDMLKRVFGPDVPTINELCNNVDMLFLNVHPIWELNRPVPPNVIYLGGLHQKPPKELPKDIKTYLDSSKNSVIYVSFGTNVEPALLPAKKIQVLLNVFSKLPYDILWKWNKDELPGRTANIKISKWLPQSDLLKHPKVKLFVTQGGLQSTDEAITAGIPLVGIPMLGDQWFNVQQYVHHKIGAQVDMDGITEEKLSNAINEILSNERYYRQNMAKLRSVMRDQPESPLDRAVWWTEYVIRHGGARHLRAPSANMPWHEYYEIELVTCVLLALLSVIIVCALIGFKVCKILRAKFLGDVKLKRN